MTLGSLREPATLVAFDGTVLIAALVARGVRGAILLGTVAAAGARTSLASR